jgi:hypothetical protein
MPNNLSRVVLIIALSFALAAPAPAESVNAAGDQVVAAIVVVSAAVAVGVIFLILHEKHKTIPITGCVTSEASGMKLTDEKDRRIYPLSGETAGVKPGDRMTLEGKRQADGKKSIFEVRRATKDFGVCPP